MHRFSQKPFNSRRAATSRRPAFAGSALAIMCAVISGCGESKMTMDGNLKGEMAGSFKLEGPVEMNIQMRGPTIRYEGIYVSDKLFEHVKVKETQTDWLLAVLGPPTGKAALDNGHQIWKWSYRPLEQEASVVSLFGGGSKDEPKLQPSTAFVRIDGKTVVEKWRD